MDYKDRLFTRVKIGGILTTADHIIITKDLLARVEALEEKLNGTTASRAGDSKLPKRKATTSRVSRKSDD